MPAPVPRVYFDASMRTRACVCSFVCMRAPSLRYILTRRSRGRKIRDPLLVISPLSIAFTASTATIVSYHFANAGDVKSPADLTIDKDAAPDLLSLERRKEMSCSSHDKYLNEEEFTWE